MKNVLARPLEIRSMPTLLEQRNQLLDKMDAIVSKAKEETRSITDDENNEFNQHKAEVEKIDRTIAAEEAAQSFTQSTIVKKTDEEEKRSLEEANFIKFIRGEERALDVAGNGGIIPQTIANRIIERVKELCPIYQMATVFNVGGDLIFPKWDGTQITTAYVADMAQLTASNGNFTTVKMQNFIAGTLTQISRSLMNRTDFNLVGFITEKVAQSIAEFLERELLLGVGGTTGATGIFTDTGVTSVVAGGANAVTIDDLIKLQMAIPEPFQSGASWIMNRSTFQGIRLLKDGTGVHLLNRDLTGEFGWTILGRPVYLSDNAPGTISTGLNVLTYGDYSGLYVKLAQNVEISVLNELYATQHATGICAYIEFDSKVIEPQRIARLRMA